MNPTTAKFLADALVVGHLAFVVFALFGAVLALRWRWVAVAHLPAVAWVIYVAVTNAMCPLTPMENDLRRTAGQSGYEGGFVDHYLMPVLYPDGLTPEVQRRMGGGILLFNLACYAGVAARWRVGRRRRAAAAAGILTSPPAADGLWGVGQATAASDPAGHASMPASTPAFQAAPGPIAVPPPAEGQVAAPISR
jgi:hypothetical protein